MASKYEDLCLLYWLGLATVDHSGFSCSVGVKIFQDTAVQAPWTVLESKVGIMSPKIWPPTRSSLVWVLF